MMRKIENMLPLMLQWRLHCAVRSLICPAHIDLLKGRYDIVTSDWRIG